jgi:hypothetical protein
MKNAYEVSVNITIWYRNEHYAISTVDEANIQARGSLDMVRNTAENIGGAVTSAVHAAMSNERQRKWEAAEAAAAEAAAEDSDGPGA